MNRLKFDLGIARTDKLTTMRRWRYLFVGKCNGDVIIRLDSRSASELDPAEFDKLTGIEEVRKLYVTNTAQVGKEFNIYFEEEDISIKGVKVRGVS